MIYIDLEASTVKNKVRVTAREEYTYQLYFSKDISEKKIYAAFDAGQVSSDGGLLLIRKMESRLGLISKVASVIRDLRHPSYVEHSIKDLSKQRVFQILSGYIDGNDCDTKCRDPVMNTRIICRQTGLDVPDFQRISFDYFCTA